MIIRRMVKIKSPQAPMPLDSHQQPMDPPTVPPTGFQSAHKKLKLFFCIFAILMGLGQAWAGKWEMQPDGISYIELGEAYFRWDLHAALNGYWSPFYCWVLGAGLKVFHPPPYWEFPFIHLVNFLIFLAALVCFNFFLASLIGYHHSQRNRHREFGLAPIPEWVWFAFGYALFNLSSLRMITVWSVSPDMCVAAFIYLVAGIILRIHSGVTTWRNYFLLGICLGFGYLSKAAVLPVAVVFILATISTGQVFRRWLPRVGITLAGLTLVAAPYVILLSLRQGQFTFSETPKLAYAFMVDNVPLMHWQGLPAGFGKPLHPTRKIFDHPAAFEFRDPIPGTYPPWYDPTYWHEGIATHFDFERQKTTLMVNGPRLADLFFDRFVAGLAVTFLVLHLFSPSWRSAIRNLARQWILLLPPLAAFVMYALVLVAPRYLAPYFTLFCAGLMAGWSLPEMPQSRDLMTALTIPAFVTVPILLILTVTDGIISARAAPVTWQLADCLHRKGIRAGDSVADIGLNGESGWARLARVRITAEIPHESVEEFDASKTEAKAKVLESIFRTGVKAIVADTRESSGCETGWQAVSETSYYVCVARGLVPDSGSGPGVEQGSQPPDH